MGGGGGGWREAGGLCFRRDREGGGGGYTDTCKPLSHGIFPTPCVPIHLRKTLTGGGGGGAVNN